MSMQPQNFPLMLPSRRPRKSTLLAYPAARSPTQVQPHVSACACTHIATSTLNKHPQTLTKTLSLQFQYRLSKCSELSLGIFTSHEGNDIPTAATASAVYSGAPKRKLVLLGHIVATMTTGVTVTDKDMGIPSDNPSDSSLGHKPQGRTVAIHSLAVLPDFQRKGLGSTLMKGYLDRLAKQDVADKAALIAHEDMIPYYETFGFKNKGKSSAQFGGGGWFDMVKDITDEGDDY